MTEEVDAASAVSGAVLTAPFAHPAVAENSQLRSARKYTEAWSNGTSSAGDGHGGSLLVFTHAFDLAHDRGYPLCGQVSEVNA